MFGLGDPVKVVMVAVLTGVLIGILGFFSEFWRSRYYHYPGPYLSIPLFISYVVGSILEEVIWRAYVLRALGFGWMGLVVSSVFFGLHHVGLGLKNFVFAVLQVLYWVVFI